MKAPAFWSYGSNNLKSLLLAPIAAIYNGVTCKRANKTPQFKATVPVICIGNLIMGGAGKTPTAISIAKYLQSQEKKPIFLSRGYGGNLSGPVMVENQTADQVGDEPLLLMGTAPVCIAHDRIAGAKLCEEQGCDIIIMDDGFQNPHLHKDLSILVVDGGYGHGNDKVFPAGPLRETLSNGFKRAHAVVIIGEDQTSATRRINELSPNLPILNAAIQPDDSAELAGQKVIAFAGIGRPEKFFETLAHLGADICESIGFNDHHTYTEADISHLKSLADKHQARLFTTEKDAVKLPEKMKEDVSVIKISLEWESPDMLKQVLSSVLSERA